MRCTRLKMYKKKRHRIVRNIFFVAFILPTLCVLAGYAITSLVVLPNMVK